MSNLTTMLLSNRVACAILCGLLSSGIYAKKDLLWEFLPNRIKTFWLNVQGRLKAMEEERQERLQIENTIQHLLESDHMDMTELQFLFETYENNPNILAALHDYRIFNGTKEYIHQEIFNHAMVIHDFQALQYIYEKLRHLKDEAHKYYGGEWEYEERLKDIERSITEEEKEMRYQDRLEAVKLKYYERFGPPERFPKPKLPSLRFDNYDYLKHDKKSFLIWVILNTPETEEKVQCIRFICQGNVHCAYKVTDYLYYLAKTTMNDCEVDFYEINGISCDKRDFFEHVFEKYIFIFLEYIYKKGEKDDSNFRKNHKFGEDSDFRKLKYYVTRTIQSIIQNESILLRQANNLVNKIIFLYDSDQLELRDIFDYFLFNKVFQCFPDDYQERLTEYVIDFLESRLTLVQLLSQHGVLRYDSLEQFQTQMDSYFNKIIEPAIEKYIGFNKILNKKIKTIREAMCEAVRDDLALANAIFLHDDKKKKDYIYLFEQLTQQCKTPARWLLNNLRERWSTLKKRIDEDQEKCWQGELSREDFLDNTLIDMNNISRFCLDRMNYILSPGWRSSQETQQDIDEATRNEIVSWRDFFFYLDKDLKTRGNEWDLRDTLMLRIVEQGYSGKELTYNALRPLLKLLLQRSTDISVQNRVEGSIIHLFARRPFDIPMVKLIFKTYKKKDSRRLYFNFECNFKLSSFSENLQSLYLACCGNNESHFYKSNATPMKVTKGMLKDCGNMLKHYSDMLKNCNDQEQKKEYRDQQKIYQGQQRAYQDFLQILQDEVPIIQRKVLSHYPCVDNAVIGKSALRKLDIDEKGNIDNLAFKKTMEWKLAHNPNI